MSNIKSKTIDILVISFVVTMALTVVGFTQRVAASEQLAFSPVVAQKDSTLKDRDPALECTGKKCNLMRKYVNPIIAFLTAVAGIAITIGLIIGGLRYAAAGDDPQKVTIAKKQISTAILALVSLLLLYAALRWLIPGLGG